MALLIALSILSLGIFSLFAFSIRERRRGLESGSVPPALAAIVISFPNLVNVRAILPQRLNFLSFLKSSALPIISQSLYDSSFLTNKIIFQFVTEKCIYLSRILPVIEDNCLEYECKPLKQPLYF